MPGEIVVTDSFGRVRSNGKVHSGVDLRARTPTPILAVDNARVLEVAFDSTCGLYIKLELERAPNLHVVYCHLSEAESGEGGIAQAGLCAPATFSARAARAATSMVRICISACSTRGWASTSIPCR